MKDDKVLAAAKEAFDPNQRSPEMIRALRAKLAAKNPAAWQDLKRAWLDKEVTDSLRTAQSGEIVNPAGKILSALEDPKMKRSLDAALTDAEKSSFADLRFLLRKVANAKLGMGSDTAANQEADRIARERAIPLLAKLMRFSLDFTHLGSNTAEAIADANLSAQAKYMMKLVTSGDPQALLALKQLRQLTPSQWRAIVEAGGKAGVAVSGQHP